MDREHSAWGITDKESNRTITPGYKGIVFIDRTTGQILRFTAEAVDIPSDFPIQLAQETLIYEYADLSGSKFLLPSQSEVRLGAEYRKFSADAVISFDDVDKKPQ